VDLSVVIPMRDEREAALPLLDELDRVLPALGVCEIVIVDDGSIDGTGRRLATIAAARPPDLPRLRVVRHREAAGQSAALRTGVGSARAAWVVTLDGDGQNDPADIPRLVAARRRARPGGGPVLVAGERRRRRDGWVKRASSRIANAVRRRVLGDGVADTGCGLKLFPRAAYRDLPFFDHQHRFLPALFLRDGVPVVTVAVGHRPRAAGRSKYGVGNRLWVGLVDLAGVWWLLRRGRKVVLEEASAAHPPVTDEVEPPASLLPLEAAR
jgi:dolichol-phosphate mannosyltransferase